MRDCLRDRQALDALGTPLGGYFAAGYAPDLLCIVLEESAIQAVTKAIEKKIFERVFGLPKFQLRLTVAQANSQGLNEAHVLQRIRVELQGVVEESTPIEDARKPPAHQ